MRSGAYRRRANPPNTAFRRFYERGDLPIAMEHRGMKNVIRWKARMGSVHACAACTYILNLQQLLPMQNSQH